MSNKGEVTSKDMFPAPTIYDDPRPTHVDLTAKYANDLGVREGEIVAVIIERRATGGATMVKLEISAEREVAEIPKQMKKLGDAFLEERRRKQ